MSSDDEDLLNFTVIKNLKSTQKQNEEKIKPTSPLPKISTSAISKSRVSPPKATEWIEKKKKGEPGNFDKPVTPSRARPSSSTKPVIVSVEEELIESPSPKKLEVLHKKPNGSASQPKKFSDQLSPSKPVKKFLCASSSQNTQISKTSSQPSAQRSSSKRTITFDEEVENLVPSKVTKRKKDSASIVVTPSSSSAAEHVADVLYVDKYAPKTETDLAIHKKKIKEVREWLRGAILSPPSKQKMLLLTGPTGSGKSSLIRVLAAEAGVEICEWINPVALKWKTIDDWSRNDCTPPMTAFREFLLRAERYPSLLAPSPPSTAQPQTATPSPTSGKRQLILVEDLPMLIDSNRDEFRRTLVDFLRMSSFPLCLIMSDVYLGSTDANLVLGPELLSLVPRLICKIGLNPVAPTLLDKALERVVNAERIHITADEVLGISEESGGDLRHAMNSLQFLALRNSTTTNAPKSQTTTKGSRKGTSWKDLKVSRRSAKKAKSGTGFSAAGSDDEAEFYDAEAMPRGNRTNSFCGRDLSMSLFHAIGRILMNKRKPLKEKPVVVLDDNDAEGVEVGSSPAVAPHTANDLRRLRGPPEYEPEAVVDRVYMDPAVFNSFLHQNYVELFSDVDDLAMAAEYMSYADQLLLHRADASTLGPYATSLVTRGLQYANSNPVKPKWNSFCKPQQSGVQKVARETSQAISAFFTSSGSATSILGSLVPTAVTTQQQSFTLSETGTALLTETLPALGQIVRSIKVRQMLASSSLATALSPTQRQTADRISNFHTWPRWQNLSAAERLDQRQSAPPPVEDEASELISYEARQLDGQEAAPPSQQQQQQQQQQPSPASGSSNANPCLLSNVQKATAKQAAGVRPSQKPKQPDLDDIEEV